MKGFLKNPKEQTNAELKKDYQIVVKEERLEEIFELDKLSEETKDYFREYTEELIEEYQRRGLEKDKD